MGRSLERTYQADVIPGTETPRHKYNLHGLVKEQRRGSDSNTWGEQMSNVVPKVHGLGPQLGTTWVW